MDEATEQPKNTPTEVELAIQNARLKMKILTLCRLTEVLIGGLRKASGGQCLVAKADIYELAKEADVAQNLVKELHLTIVDDIHKQVMTSELTPPVSSAPKVEEQTKPEPNDGEKS